MKCDHLPLFAAYAALFICTRRWDTRASGVRARVQEHCMSLPAFSCTVCHLFSLVLLTDRCPTASTVTWSHFRSSSLTCLFTCSFHHFRFSRHRSHHCIQLWPFLDPPVMWSLLFNPIKDNRSIFCHLVCLCVCVYVHVSLFMCFYTCLLMLVCMSDWSEFWYIIIAVISTALYVADKGEHTVLYNINKNVYIKTSEIMI